MSFTVSDEDIFFAAVGDVHGHFYSMLGMLQGWENRTGHSLAFVLQVGDFEPHRDAADVATMDAPAKYRKVGEFPNFYTGKAMFPWPIWFIGGNHEPYGFLDRCSAGEAIAPNCFYLGRVGAVMLEGVNVVGVSGVYREERFTRGRPDIAQCDRYSNQEYIGFTEAEIERALELRSPDILLLHDWPCGAINPADAAQFVTCKYSIDYTTVGNEYARLLVDFLVPQWVLCGHLHVKYRHRIAGNSGRETQFLALANVQSGRDAIAFFRVTPEGQIVEYQEK